MEMRRKDREVTDPEKIRQIIDACDCCRIGFCDENGVYIVPLNFGVVWEGEQCTFYFHSAKQGRKIDLIRRRAQVGFELDTNYQLHTAEDACGHSARFQSVIGTGHVSLVEDAEEQVRGLRALMAHHTGKGDWSFAPEMLRAVAVFKLTVRELRCKEHV